MNQLAIKKNNELFKKRKKGFTLVELIIVIAIIAILAALAIPKFSAVRLDAKVSNDVAAAKNIQTQVATLIADGDISGSTTIDLSDKTADSTSMKIKDRLDGKASTGSTEALASGHFSVVVDGKESITVSATAGTGDAAKTYQLYPDNDGTYRTAYTKGVK